MNKLNPSDDPLRIFVQSNKDKIEKEGKDFKLDKKLLKTSLKDIRNYRYSQLIEDEANATRKEKRKAKREAKCQAYTDIIEAFRYMSFTLADYANHSEAKSIAYLNNHYRTKYWWASRQYIKFIWKFIFGLCTGYLQRPLRLFITTLFIWFVFASLFWFITYSTPSDYQSIAFTQSIDAPIEIYHYGYFSALTLTTLGYGDITINHNEKYKKEALIMIALCSIEAAMGYVVLGFGVAMLFRYFDFHPYGRIDRWLDTFEKNWV